ncbi:MAG: winged helix-turn-helix domain-containing protein [Thermoguttaceae bacterium]|nr:winged helix-turn-helix domain-containing protein [Thermoguttaceae bacterium]MDW8039721.1 winged helix-turn-helix domain-containing protein [Thermoguttaceae bacterium]
MDQNEVNTAFEILLEELEQVGNALNEQGSQAFRTGDYEQAKRCIEEAIRLQEFHSKVRDLQKEWQRLAAGRFVRAQGARTRRTRERLPRGLRTPEDAFRRPILEALSELGGQAPMNKVLDLVEQKMKSILNQYDKQPLPSDPRTLRWRNTAQWCRNTLVREGLLKEDSPHGVWELTEAGRAELNKQS